MKKIKISSAAVLTVFLDMVEAVDEIRLELEDHPTLLIQWGAEIRTIEGLGRLIAVGLLQADTRDQFECRMEFVVYDGREMKGNKLTGKITAFAISRRLDHLGKHDTACTMTGNRVTTVFHYEQEALTNIADRWLAELANMGYPAITVK